MTVDPENGVLKGQKKSWFKSSGFWWWGKHLSLLNILKRSIDIDIDIIRYERIVDLMKPSKYLFPMRINAILDHKRIDPLRYCKRSTLWMSDVGQNSNWDAHHWRRASSSFWGIDSALKVLRSTLIPDQISIRSHPVIRLISYPDSFSASLSL